MLSLALGAPDEIYDTFDTQLWLDFAVDMVGYARD